MVYRLGSLIIHAKLENTNYPLQLVRERSNVRQEKKEIRRNSTSLVRPNPLRGIDFQSLGGWSRNLIFESYFFLSPVRSLLFSSLINIPSLSRSDGTVPECPLFEAALTPAALVFARILEENENVQRWFLYGTSPRSMNTRRRHLDRKGIRKKISSRTSILSF